MREVTGGKCIIFSAPSGAGKTTIVKHLLNNELLNLQFSISACSRPARPGEEDTKDYYFLDVDTFKKRIDEDAFIEWEEVYKDNFYGTLKSEIERIWAEGKNVIFDVDVVGGLSLKKHFGDKALAIFVMPPSVDALETRLRSRQTETEEKIQIRMNKAKTELDFANKFDTILLNDELSRALKIAEEKVYNFLQEA